jgi:hypothetical protein
LEVHGVSGATSSKGLQKLGSWDTMNSIRKRLGVDGFLGQRKNDAASKTREGHFPGESL